MKTCATRLSRPPSPFFTSVIPRTPSRPGIWRSRSATSRITARSIPSSRTAAGCAPRSAKFVRGSRWARGFPSWKKTSAIASMASFDNGLELRLLEGLSSEEAMLAMVPPAFEKDPLLSRDVRGALSSLSQQSEPWDGPAALVFSDGEFVGAKLDRNGLRPMRYTLTHDGLLIAGSETGLVDL